MTDVTTELQKVIDSFPDCFFAEDMVSVTQTLAKSFQNTAHGDVVQIANINELLMVGQQLQKEGGDGPNPEHSGISGLLCKGSEGRTRFLSVYAKCFRRDFALSEQRGSIWNSQYWVDAVKETFNDIGDGVAKVANGVGEGLGKVVLQLFPLIAVIIVLAVVFLVIQKKVT